MTFNSQFKLIFSDILKPEGFTYCSKLSVFAKMLNEELLAFIGVRTAPAWEKGNKGFMITAGIISVYHDSIDKNTVQYMSHQLNQFVPKEEVRVSFEYNAVTMDEVIISTAYYVKERLMPVFNAVVDLDSYIEYLKKYAIDNLRGCDVFAGESLVLIKADNHDDFQQYFKEKVDEINAQIDAGNVGEGYTKEMCYKDMYEGIIVGIVHPRDKVYNDANLYQEALKEAEKRKNANMQELKSKGVHICY